MTVEEEFRLLVSGYYGIYEMDEYELKVYILKQLENYIKEFISENSNSSISYHEIAQELEKLPIKTKLQDSLLILNRIQAPLELSLLIRKRLNEMKKS